MSDFFKLEKNGTTVKTEVTAGFTTFLTMMYIVPVNAIIMSKTGMPMDALITATALITIFSSILNGLWANTPIAMSVGMGLNAYFTFGLVLGMKVPWQTALGVVFLSGVLFLVLSLTPLRVWIMKSVPHDLRRAISAGIGSFIAFIGLKSMGMVVANPAVLVGVGNFKNPNVLLGVVGLVLVVAFYTWKLKGAFILAVVSTAIIAWVLGIAAYPSEFFSLPASVSPIALQLDIKSALTLSLFPVIITFLITDLFDSLGTLAGVGFRAGLFKDDGKELQKTLEIDALASTACAVVGVSTTTAFIESAAGVEEGGRTGLTAVVTGLCFILTLFMMPLFKAIPENAIYPVLVMVGVLMFGELSHINFKDTAIAVSTFLIVIMMPLTFSITNGLAFGLIAYVFIKLLKKEFKEINFGIIFLTLVSLTVFIVQEGH
ncbi:MAG: NCS2 family permease [Epsilonproteobacteria bacterium]|uniref:NCS2 family permease n=1 Tax=Sulfurospirillum cavolei TaxID=366522 RepID=A0A2D3WD94_9BACT|nr:MULTISPECIES: NCS2 family permease [Sulfurospirillum]NCB53491.1 NCS2 family permease [Campylobacterota bacterium]DAB36246.1 MAG TPA: NCS2 family permease [Sulfurospirillum cavolei]KHG33716.1 MAG: guanine permease [Sulfurospirillum sp. MES]MCP3653066.1 NCS2 family permease [Sulfurospirillum sp. DNRA8]MCR1811917.1 NCS2 family permease [Sulfurospirillum sp. DNRA8]